MPYSEGDAEFTTNRMVSNDGLVTMAKTLDMKKAPGLDRIATVTMRAAILAYPDMLRSVLQKLLGEGFLSGYVEGPKPGSATGEPRIVGPTCLLDVLRNLLERPNVRKGCPRCNSASAMSMTV